MNMRDLIPWTRSQDLLPEFLRDERSSPFLTLHREMNRLLEEAFRGFASTSLAGRRTEFVNPAWPKLEVVETEKQITVSAEIPGMEEKDVELLLNDGNLILRGEMNSETEDKERQFSERFYGRFERQIPVGMDIDKNKVEASFKEWHSQGRFAEDRASADEGKTDRHQRPNQTLMLDPRGSWRATGASCRLKSAVGKPDASPGHPGHANVSRSEAESSGNARELETALTQTP